MSAEQGKMLSYTIVSFALSLSLFLSADSAMSISNNELSHSAGKTTPETVYKIYIFTC